MVETVAEILTLDPVTQITPYSNATPYQPETVFTTVGQVLGSSGIVNCMARLFRGFPVNDDLRIDLQNGISEISVFSVPGMTRLISKFFQDEYVAFTVPITLTITTTNNTATLGGTCTTGQVVGIAVGDGQIKTAYCYRLQTGDTLTTVVAALVALIPGATSSGDTITVPDVVGLLVGVTSDSTVNYDNALYSQMIDVHLWCPNPQTRDALGAVITSGMSQTFNLDFVDGSTTENILYRGIWVSDAAQSTTDWSSYLRFEVQYPNVLQKIVPGILFMGIELNSDKVIGVFSWQNTDPVIL